jgi:multidrug efflux pump subunit AcrB
MKIVSMFLRKSKLVLLVSVIVIVAGVLAYSEIPKQKMPDIAPPIGSYQIMAPGFSASEMQEIVIDPIEEIIHSVEPDANVNAKAFDDFALINIFLDVGEPNPDDIWAEISSEIALLDLPDQVFSPVFQDKFDFSHAIYSLNIENKSFAEIEEVANLLADDISDIESISTVDVIGTTYQQLEITIDVDSLNELPLTVSTITNLIFANGLNMPVGKLTTLNDKVSVEVPMTYDNIEDIKNIVVGFNQEAKLPIILGDITEMTVSTVSESTSLYVNGSKAVFVNVFFKDNLDITKLGDELNDVVDNFENDYSGYNIENMVFQPESVNDSMETVNTSLIQGVIFVLLVIIIGLGFRNALSVAFTFPLIIFATVLGLMASGQELQMISIAGLIITIGVIVDNSIVISESIQHYMDLGYQKKAAIIKSVQVNASPVLASTLTTIAAFIPLLLIGGAVGKMMFALPLTVIIAITISYFVAMLVSPVLASLLFKPKKNKRKLKLFDTNSLHKPVNFAIQHPIVIILISLILFIGSVGAMINLQPIELFPTTEESILYINYEYNDSNDVGEIENYANDIVEIVESYSDIEYLSYSIGGDLPRFDNSVETLEGLPTIGRVFVKFDISYVELEIIKEKLIDELEPLQDQGDISVNELLFGPAGSGIEVNLYSDDYQDVELLTKVIESDINDLKDVKSVSVDYPTYQEKYLVNLDRDLLAKNQLIAVNVQNQIRNLIGSNTSGEFINGEDVISIETQTNITSIEDLENSGILSTITGEKTLLKDLGTVKSVDSIYSISTKDGLYQLTIDVIPIGDDASSLQAEVEDIVDSYTLNDVEVSYGGEKELKDESFTSLGQAAIIAIILIYLIMLAQFNSFKQPLIILATIPLALIGSALAAIIIDVPITFTVVLGIVALMGIVVNSGILLIDYINVAREEGENLRDACIKSVERRIRPIVLSSVTTILGLVPLALYGGSFFAPMAVTLMGGLTVSTLLTIFVIPALYYMVEKDKDPKGIRKDQLRVLEILEEKKYIKQEDIKEIVEQLKEID